MLKSIVTIAMMVFSSGYAMQNNPHALHDFFVREMGTSNLDNFSRLLDSNSQDLASHNQAGAFLMDAQGNTLLHAAAVSGNIDAITIILEKSKEVNALICMPNGSGNTAIHAAIDALFHKTMENLGGSKDRYNSCAPYMKIVKGLLSAVNPHQKQFLLAMPTSSQCNVLHTVVAMLSYVDSMSRPVNFDVVYDLINIMLENASDKYAIVFDKDRRNTTPYSKISNRLKNGSPESQAQIRSLLDLVNRHLNS